MLFLIGFTLRATGSVSVCSQLGLYYPPSFKNHVSHIHHIPLSFAYIYIYIYIYREREMCVCVCVCVCVCLEIAGWFLLQFWHLVSFRQSSSVWFASFWPHLPHVWRPLHPYLQQLNLWYLKHLKSVECIVPPSQSNIQFLLPWVS